MTFQYLPVNFFSVTTLTQTDLLYITIGKLYNKGVLSNCLQFIYSFDFELVIKSLVVMVTDC